MAIKKTAALFGLAASLLIGAVAVDLFGRLGRDPGPTPPTPPTPPPIPATSSGAGAISLGDLVRLDAALSNDFVSAGGPSSDLFLRINLEARDVRRGDRLPMAVAVVIDRSGSMAGDKMEKARQAAKGLVDKLSDGDRVAIVSYATETTVDLPLTAIASADKARLHKVIDGIFDGGGTNLSGGLEAGLEQLRAARGDSVISRLILMSDGNANQGITDPREIGEIARRARQSGVTVSTLGVGVDFNEDLMTGIAENAGGAYYYARDGVAIATALDSELKGLLKIAARRVEVGFELPSNVTVREVFGYRTEVQGGRLVVPVGDMAGGEKRRVIVRLTVSDPREGSMELTKLALGYVEATGDTAREFRGALAATGTRDAGALLRGERREVVEAAEGALAAQVRKQAADDFSSNDKAGAIQKLTQQLQTTRAKAAALNSPSLAAQADELEAAAKSIGSMEATTEGGKDLVKQEKYRARQIFAY